MEIHSELVSIMHSIVTLLRYNSIILLLLGMQFLQATPELLCLFLDCLQATGATLACSASAKVCITPLP